jgi:hypothetical protein
MKIKLAAILCASLLSTSGFAFNRVVLELEHENTYGVIDQDYEIKLSLLYAVDFQTRQSHEFNIKNLKVGQTGSDSTKLIPLFAPDASGVYIADVRCDLYSKKTGSLIGYKRQNDKQFNIPKGVSKLHLKGHCNLIKDAHGLHFADNIDLHS